MADNLQQPMNLVHPSGQIVSVDPENVEQAFKSGFKVPTQDQLDQGAAEARYGNHPGLAALTGAVTSMAPFGIGEAALSHLGARPEDIKGIMEQNPGATTVGQIGGLFAPSPIGLAKIASGLGKAVAPASKVLGTVGSEALGSAVEGAAYGGSNVVNEAVLGNPDEVAEHALSEIGTSAMWGAGIGGALGILGHTIPPAVGKAQESANSLMDSLGLMSAAEKVKNSAKEGYATLSSMASGVPKEDILAAIANRGTDAIPLDSEEISSNLQSHFDSLEQAKKTALKDIRPEEVERLVSTVPPEVAQNEASKVYGAFDDAIKTMRTEPELYPATYARQLELIRDSLPRKVNSESSPAVIFKSLNELKQNLDTKIPYEKVPSAAAQNAIGTIKDLRGQVKDSLENPDIWGEAGSRQAKFNEALSDYLKSVNSGAQKGEFAKSFMLKSGGSLKVDPVKVETFLKNTQTTRGIKSAQALAGFVDSSNKLLNEIEQSYKAIPEKSFDKASVQDLIQRNQDVIEQNRQRAVLNRMSGGAEAGGSGLEPIVAGGIAHAVGLSHPVVGAIFGAAEALRYPGQTIQRLAKLEDTLNKSYQKISRAAKVLTSPSEKAAQYLKGYAANKLAITTPDQYEKKVKEIQDLVTNPPALLDKLHASTEQLASHAPNASTSMQATASRALGFLASKIIQAPNQGPLAPKLEPSMAQISEFNKYYTAVNKPLSVLKEAVAGLLTHQGVEVLTQVYPTLYASIKTSIAKEMTKDASDLPYSRKLMLSLLMGADMDGTTQPQRIIANQQMLGISAMQQQAKDAAFQNSGKVRAKGLDNLSMSDRALTAQQKTAQRSE